MRESAIMNYTYEALDDESEFDIGGERMESASGSLTMG